MFCRDLAGQMNVLCISMITCVKLKDRLRGILYSVAPNGEIVYASAERWIFKLESIAMICNFVWVNL